MSMSALVRRNHPPYYFAESTDPDDFDPVDFLIYLFIFLTPAPRLSST